MLSSDIPDGSKRTDADRSRGSSVSGKLHEGQRAVEIYTDFWYRQTVLRYHYQVIAKGTYFLF